MNKRFFCYIFIAIALGIQIAVEVPFAMILALTGAGISILFYKKRILAIFTLTLSVFIVITSGTYPVAEKAYKDITITGTVQEVIEYDNNTSFVLEDCNHTEIGKFKVNLYLDDYDISGIHIKEGNIIEVTGNAEPVSKRNVNFYETANILEDYYVFNATEYEIKDDGTDENYFFRRLRDKVRQRIFLNSYDTDSATVIYAMVSGDKQYIDDSVKDIFTSCGTSHLLAVSGLHVSIILGVIMLLLRGLKANNKIAFILLCLFLIFYGCFTGGASSVIRACIMALVLQLSLVYGARYDSLNSLCFAGSTILAVEPFRLYDVGFMLSFAACFGIIWISKFFVKKPGMFKGVINGMLVTIGATVATMPIQLYYFRIVSIISVVANVLLVPVASVVLALAFIFLIPALLWAPAGILLNVPGAIMAYVIKIAQWLGNFPFIEFEAIPLIVMFALFVGFLFFTRFVHMKKKYVAGTLMIVLPLVWVGTAVFYNNSVKASVINYNGSDGFIHIEDGKNYIIGVEDENLLRQTEYISQHMLEIDVLILTGKKDVENFKASADGLKYNELYVTPNVELDRVLKRAGAKPLLALEGEKGDFKFESTLYYLCGEEKINLNRLRKNQSLITYIRS